MKVLKKVFYGLVILCMLFFGFVMLCALKPELTELIARQMYGKEQNAGEPEAGAESGEQGALVIPGISDFVISTEGIDLENLPFREVPGYVLPSSGTVSTPGDLVGKNGYRPTEGSNGEIDEDTASQIRRELGCGELGSGLQFTELMYPYYGMLTEEMKQLYRQLYANAENRLSSFQPVVVVNSKQLGTVFEALIGDHPELFWMETGYSCKQTTDGNVVEISLEFYDFAKYIETAKSDFSQMAEIICEEAKKLSTDAEKEKYVHDALLHSVEYRAGADYDQSAYSGLVTQKTVCAGYARAFQYLMQQLGIPCYYCTGFSGENHAWNIVSIDGVYRNVDVTWDDNGKDPYAYYNKPDSAFAGTHRRTGLSVYLPGCPDDSGKDEKPSALEGIKDLINPNPIKPITLQNPEGAGGENDTPTPGDGLESPSEEGLAIAGIKASDVMNTLADYYKDCRKRVLSAGTGQFSFSNCIPASLWNTIEEEYTAGKHRSGYVDSVLQELEADNFAIRIQVVRLGGGYYRIYHHIAIW